MLFKGKRARKNENMIILLGLSKSGTSSFQKLFSDLGLNSIHWLFGNYPIASIMKENKEKGRPILEGFEEVDCITQMDVCVSEEHCFWPQVTEYKQIYEENADAIFILNKRDPQKILSSFKNWHNLLKRLYKFNPELVNNKTDEGFVEFVNEHFHNIENFFKDAKFISYDIEKDSLSKLSKYIDIKDQTELPRVNVNQNKKPVQ